jgi:hypothetical protein
MIGHEAFAESFSDLASYLEYGDDGSKAGRIAWHEGRNVWAPTVADGASVMAALSAASPTRKPVYHLSVSFDPGDRPGRPVMVAVADRLIADLGLQDHLAVIVAHRDRDHAHFHLMVSRVHPVSGRLWKIDFSMREVERSLRHQERELGLRENPGHLYRLPGQARPERSASVGAGVLRRESRTGTRPYVEIARQQLAADLRDARGYEDLELRLALRGHRLEERRRGLVVTDGTHYAALSAVSATASRPKLESRFGESFSGYLRRRGQRRAAEPRAGGDSFAGERPGAGAAPDAASSGGGHGRGAGVQGEAGWSGGRGAGPAASDPRGTGPAVSAEDREGHRGRDSSGHAHGKGGSRGDGRPAGNQRAGSAAGHSPDGGAADGVRDLLRESDAGVRGNPGADGEGAGRGDRRRQGAPPTDVGRVGRAAAAARDNHHSPDGKVRGDGEAAGVAPMAARDLGGAGPSPRPHTPAAGVDHGSGPAEGGARRAGGDLHLHDRVGGGARLDPPGDALASSGTTDRSHRPPADATLEVIPGAVIVPNAGATQSGERFTLFEDAGIPAVFDALGPELFFAVSRDRALEEVRRANEAVSFVPTVDPTHHLRELDVEGRRAHGLPELPIQANPTPMPEPELSPGAVPPDREPANTTAADSTTVDRFLVAAAEVEILDQLRRDVETARVDLDRTGALMAEIAAARPEGEAAIARLRAALQQLYGTRSDEALGRIRSEIRHLRTARAIALVRDDPRRLLAPATGPLLLPGGLAERERASEAIRRESAALSRLELAIHGATGLVEGVVAESSDDAMHVVVRLQQSVVQKEAAMRDALAAYDDRAPALTTPVRLRRAWASLEPNERAAVESVRGNVAELFGSTPPRSRDRERTVSHGL